MSTPRWERTKDLLAKALALPSAKRRAFLEEVCEDEEMLQEVLSMLAAAESASDEFLVAPRHHYEAEAPDSAIEKELGEFRLLEEIGRGGMGVVYLAEQKGLERLVAVKVLHVHITTTQRSIDRFHREARAAAKLKHRGIVPIFATGRSEDAHYFAMEYVPGGDLAAELQRQHEEDPDCVLPRPGAPEHLASVARLVAELAEALQYAHDAGVVHRDVKPQNILIGDDGELRIVDFGLAKDESQGSLSQTDVIAGTPHYMSPEQATARRHNVDHRTDVYSLGTVLYEMCTLERPFGSGSHEEVISRVINTEPVPVRKLNARVPRDLDTICAKAMAKRKEDRYASAAAFGADLRHFLDHEAIEARPPGLWKRTGRFARKHALVIGALLVALFGGFGGTVWSAYRVAEASREALVVELRALDGVADWAEADDDRLRAANAALAGLRVDLPRAEEDRELVERMAVRFELLRDAWYDGAVQRIAESRKAVAPEALGAVQMELVLEGFLLATRALKAFPNDTDIRSLIRTDIFDPRVSLSAVDEDGRPLQGNAAYVVLDQVTGLPTERVELGPLPVGDRPVPPGFYRFVLEPEAAPAREFTRLLRIGRTPPPVRCVVRDDHGIDGMVLIQGADMTLPFLEEQDGKCPIMGRTVRVPSFYIDEAEVSVAEYRSFLEATGHPEPENWEYLPDDPAFDDRPAVSMSWYDARAYAEWAGKRLVSHAEWELAARGAVGDLFSRPVDSTAPGQARYHGAVFGTEESKRNRELRFRDYLEHTLPVRDPEGLGRNGLYHMLGNVREMTESLAFQEEEDGSYSPRPERRLLLSSPWFAAEESWNLSQHKLWGPEADYANPKHGFRCARSVSP